MISVTGCPMISSAVYPNRRSALLFQLVMIPFKSLLAMASSEDSMIAARWLFTDGFGARSAIFTALDDENFGIWTALLPLKKGIWRISDENSLLHYNGNLDAVFGLLAASICTVDA